MFYVELVESVMFTTSGINARKQCIRKFAYQKKYIGMEISWQAFYLNVSKFNFLQPALKDILG